MNDWTLQNRPRVFAENERVVVFGETSFGRIAVILVAATNVGQISLAFMDLHVNRVPPWERKPQQVEFPLTAPITLKAGDKLGCFHMGSSVLVLLEKSPENQLSLAPKAVLYGQSI